MTDKKDTQNDSQVIDVGSTSVVEKDIEILPDDLDGRINIIKKQNNALMKIMDTLLEPETDYGTVPGVDKPFLWQTGAQQLGLVFKLRPVFEVISSTIDWNRNPIYISYEVKCQLYNKETDVFLGEGVGSCNNYEKKYKYYWKYPNKGDKYREVFEDPLDRQNTLLKMAKKRAQVDATLNVTGASRLFTQDDDLVPPQKGNYKNNKNVSPEETVMPFGKHKGKKLADIPESYLKWLSTNANQEDLKKKAAQVLDNRKNNSSSNKNSNSGSDKDTTETERELTDREKEIEEIIGDNKESKKDLYDYLGYFKVKKIDDLNDDQYEDLKNLLKQINSFDFDPDNINLSFE